MKHSFLYLLAALFLFACADSAERTENPVVGEPVNMRIHLSAAPMQTAEPHAETRAVSDKLPDEQTIHQAWLLQFNGTAAASTLVAVPQKLTMDAAGNTDVSLQAGTGTHRIYIVANVDETTVNTLTAGTTLGAFETKVFPCGAMTVETMASQGLPMSAYKDIDMATGLANQSFELISRMARVAFGWTLPANLEVTAITVLNLPKGMVCKPDLAITSDKQRLGGVDYGGELDIPITNGSPVVCYVPENLAGVKADITKETERSELSATNFGNNATYLLLETGKEASNKITISDYCMVLGTDLATRVGDQNVKGNYAYQISLDIKGNNSTTDQRVRNTVYDNRSVDATGKPATANCYMINFEMASKNPYHYIDPTVMGNGATTPAHTKGSVDGDDNFPAITPVPLVPVSAEVLWESQNGFDACDEQLIVNSLRFFHGKLLFFAGGDGRGNAVIAVRDAKGDIIWSWHIWVTVSDPEGIPLNPITDGAGFTVSGMQIMDRNLGALYPIGGAVSSSEEDYGLFYQWGRKDPFPGASGNEVNSWFPTTHNENWKDATDGTPEKAVANPMTYYKYSYRTGDWTVRNDNLWGAPLTGTATFTNGAKLNTNAGAKSIYDPCPIGWKVMPAYTLAMATTENSVPVRYGRNFYKQGTTGAAKSDLIIPFAGIQSGNSKDEIEQVGETGFYQTSSANTNGDPYATNSSIFDGVDYVFVSEVKRSQGLSVRCVKE